MSTATISSDCTSFLPQNDEVDGANIQGQLTDHRSSDVKDKCDVLVSEELHLVRAELVLLSDNNEAEDELRLGGFHSFRNFTGMLRPVRASDDEVLVEVWSVALYWTTHWDS